MNRNDPQVLRLASAAEVDPRTAQRALEGRPIRSKPRKAVEAAAKRLRIKLPPEQS
jgi:hypothetical protein